MFFWRVCWMILTNYSGFGSRFNMKKKMLCGRNLTVLTGHFENYLVLRYRRMWIINLWRWLVSKIRWRFGKGFFAGCSDTMHYLSGWMGMCWKEDAMWRRVVWGVSEDWLWVNHLELWGMTTAHIVFCEVGRLICFILFFLEVICNSLQ